MDTESTPQASAPSAEDSPPAPAKAPAPTAPSVWQRLRRWLLSAAILLAGGFLAAVFSLYLPERQAVQQAQAYAQHAQQTAQAQSTQSAGRIAELQTAAGQASRLQAELRQAQALNAILSARLDAATAQLALQKGDAAAAAAALAGTAQKLEDLKQLLSAQNANRVDTLLARLELALSEMEADAYAAQSDLDVLIKGLQQLEAAGGGFPF